MLKRFAWLGKLVAAGLILSFLSIWTTGYIVTSYVESILKQFNLPLEVPPMTMTGVWGKLWGSDPLLESDVANTDADGDSPLAIDAFGQEQEPPITGMGVGGGSEANGGTGAPGGGVAEVGGSGSSDGGGGISDNGGTADGADLQGGSDGSGGESANGSSSDGGAGGSTDANGANSNGASGGQDDQTANGGDGAGANSGSAGGEIDGTETAMSTEELSEVKQQMSDEDKQKLFALLMNKLPQNTWQTISQYVENGLTEQELTTIQQIMAQHLDKEEYEQMMTILKKY